MDRLADVVAGARAIGRRAGSITSGSSRFRASSSVELIMYASASRAKSRSRKGAGSSELKSCATRFKRISIFASGCERSGCCSSARREIPFGIYHHRSAKPIVLTEIKDNGRPYGDTAMGNEAAGPIFRL